MKLNFSKKDELPLDPPKQHHIFCLLERYKILYKNVLAPNTPNPYICVTHNQKFYGFVKTVKVLNGTGYLVTQDNDRIIEIRKIDHIGDIQY